MKNNTNNSKNNNNATENNNTKKVAAVTGIVITSKDVSEKSNEEIKKEMADKLNKSRTEAMQTEGGTNAGEQPQAAQPTPAINEKKEPTIEEQQRAIEEQKRALEMTLKRLEEKKAAAEKRDRFIQTKNDLQDLRELLRKDHEFETEHCQLRLSRLSAASYKTEWETMFTISNTMILEKFCTWLNGEVDAKLDELEAEILK